jgi:indole-3-glycerol phosphate synthase
VQAAVWTPPTGTLGILVAEARRRGAALADREGELTTAAREASAAPGFAGALARETVALIAEVKRRSPSKGAINPSLDAAAQARAYEQGGASAISVLTEPSHFGGSADDLTEVVAAVRVPVLKKDFHVHPVQLLEAKALGAAAALLIVRALSPDELTTLCDFARAIELETLVEVRDENELARALAAGARVIGINNRDLETLKIDPATARRLLPLIPRDVIAIAESGMQNAADVEAAAAAGADAVLVGSFVSAAPDPAGAVRALGNVRRVERRG